MINFFNYKKNRKELKLLKRILEILEGDRQKEIAALIAKIDAITIQLKKTV